MILKRTLNVLMGSFLVSSLLILTGCFSGADSRGFVGQGTPGAASVHSSAGANSVIQTADYVFEKRAPSMVSVGSTFEYVYVLTPRRGLADVVVMDSIPEGAELKATVPQAIIEGNEFKWDFPILEANKPVMLRASVSARECVDMQNCAKVIATPFACTMVRVCEPELVICKNGPKCVCVGDCITFEITVGNKGNFAAREVVVTDLVPEGLEHLSGRREISLNMGTIAPGQSRTARVQFNVLEEGELCNVAKVNANGCEEVEASACVLVQSASLMIEKMGPAEQFMEKPAKYQILVRNTGSMDLRNVVVTDMVPAGAQVVDSFGGMRSGNEVHWNIPMLASGETRTMEICLVSACPGVLCNRAMAYVQDSCCGEIRECAETRTEWVGHPALCVEVCDDCDPVLCGEHTRYRIKITNQGSAPDSQVEVLAILPEEMDPVSAEGPSVGTITGKEVLFAPVNELAPRRFLEYIVTSKAVKEGDARVKVMIRSNTLKAPLTEEESTQVY